MQNEISNQVLPGFPQFFLNINNLKHEIFPGLSRSNSLKFKDLLTPTLGFFMRVSRLYRRSPDNKQHCSTCFLPLRCNHGDFHLLWHHVHSPYLLMLSKKNSIKFYVFKNFQRLDSCCLFHKRSRISSSHGNLVLPTVKLKQE